ncbi:MAG TPA: hypothetical protein VFD58_36535 [Blastocatellia bacterium]|nr:hypothetical protein [Blastocatellia bacterium]
MNQAENVNYEGVLNIVRQWPTAQRLTLVQEVLKTLASEVEKTQPGERTLEQALRLVPLNQPAPTDEEVRQWLDEHRMEKYG